MADLDGETTIAFVKELTKSVAELNKEISKTGEHAGVGIRKGSDETERFGKTVERHTQHVAGMNLQMGRLSVLVRGFGAGATLAYGAFQAMSAHVQEGLNLRNLSTDLGISAQAIGKLRSQLAAAGIDSKTADQQIAALMGKFDELKTLETASPIYKEIAANDPKFARDLLNAEKYGDRLKSIQLYIDQLNKPGERSKLYLGKVFGQQPSTIAAMSKDWGDKLIQPRVYSEKELEEFNVFVYNAGTLASNVWGGFMQEMVEDTNQMIKNTKREIEGLKNFTNSVWGKGAPLSDENIMDFWDTISGEKALREKAAQDKKPGTFNERFGDWGEADEGALPKNAKPRSFTRESVVHDELDVQKDSNRVLQEIRDDLDDKRKGNSIWGSSGGNTPGTSSSSSSTGAAATNNGTQSNSSDVASGDRRVPETSSDPAYGGSPTGLDRDRFRKELDAKPWLKEKILGIAAGENKDQTANQAVIETMMNRAAVRGTTLEQAAKLVREGKGGYYAGYDPASLRNPNLRKMIEGNLEKVLQGSNVSDYATDNASGALAARERATGAFTFTKKFAGESFFRPGTAGGSGVAGTRHYAQWLARVEAEKHRAAVAAMDKSLVASRDLGGAKISVDFSGTEIGAGASPKILDEGAFKKLKISRSPQAPAAGGGVSDFNRFAFE